MAFAGKLMKRLLQTPIFGRVRYRFAIRDWLRLDELPLASDLLKTLRGARVLKPEPTSAPRGRILVIAPHSDDEAIGPGGTLLLAARAGASVTTLTLTRGAGDSGPIRAAESVAAAEHLGGACVALGLPDGAIPLDEATVTAFAAALEAARPEVVMLPFFLDDHDDHRRAGELLLAAAGRLTLRPEIWAYQVYGGVLGNVIVDITDVAEEKRGLIRLFASQMASRDWANFSLGLAAWNSRFLPRRDAAFGEMFFVVPFVDWVDVARRFFASRDGYIDRGYRET